MKQNELLNCGDISSDLNNFSVYPLLQQSSKHQSSSSSSSSTSTSSIATNKQIENDKTKFFNILKSLFAIFDPECRGSIDLNELDNLGANKNEILTDVISYLRNNRIKSETIDSENEQKNHSQVINSSSNSVNLVTNENFSKNETKSTFIKNFKSSKKSEIRSPSANKINRKHKNLDFISNDTLKTESYFVTFEEFVRASEIILNKRKYSKIMQQQQQHQKQIKQFNKLNGSYIPDINNKKIDDNLISFSNGSNSCNNLFKTSMTNFIPNVSEFSRPPQTTLRISKRNYTQIPINNVITSSSVSTSTSTSSSASSPTTATTPNSQSIHKQPQTTPATLSQAFELISNDESSDLLKPSPFPNISKIPNSLSQNSTTTTILTNANSCDLNSLIDKKNYILHQCINDLDTLKQSFLSQIKENKVKQSNIQKLKHQNLFSIDKMLLDLKELNDMNLTFKRFIDRKDQDVNRVNEKIDKINNENELKKENNNDKINFISSHKENLFDPSLACSNFKEYLDHFENNNKVINDEIENYLKEKQEKIDNLQREKSNLIRRLFEMKSDSDSLTKSILQLNTSNNNLNNCNNYDGVNNINKQTNNATNSYIAKEIPVFKERLNPPGYTTICNFIELGSKSDNVHNLKSTLCNSSHLKFNHPQQIPINVRNPI